MDSREILKRLKVDGWFEARTRGSHVQLKHATKKGLVTLPHPRKDLPTGTVKSIEKQTGLTLVSAPPKKKQKTEGR